MTTLSHRFFKTLLGALVTILVGPNPIAAKSPDRQLLELANSDLRSKSLTKSIVLEKVIYETDKSSVLSTEKGDGFAIMTEINGHRKLVAYGTAPADSIIAPVKEFLKYAGLTRGENTQLSGVPIAPLLKTKWGQHGPFNFLCPEINNRNTLTGCVTTAFAQIMNYWKHPSSGEGSVQYPEEFGGQWLDLSQSKYDWENCLDDYTMGSTDAEDLAVATLMRDVSVAIESSFSLSGTGGNCFKATSALAKHFGYSPKITGVMRDKQSPKEWNDIIRKSLEEGCPVLYTGGAHAFVCDGMDEQGLLHINWGWNGWMDGYYDMNILSPETGAIGGGGAETFHTFQTIIAGLHPDSPERPDGTDVIFSLFITNFGPYPWALDENGGAPFNSYHLNFKYANATGLQFEPETLAMIPAIYDFSGKLVYQDLTTPHINRGNPIKPYEERWDYPHNYGSQIHYANLPDGNYYVKPMWAFWENGAIKGKPMEFSWDNKMVPLKIEGDMFYYPIASGAKCIDIKDVSVEKDYEGPGNPVPLVMNLENMSELHIRDWFEVALVPYDESTEIDPEIWNKSYDIEVFPSTKVTWKQMIKKGIPSEAGTYRAVFRDFRGQTICPEKEFLIELGSQAAIHNPGQDNKKIRAIYDSGIIRLENVTHGSLIEIYSSNGIRYEGKVAQNGSMSFDAASYPKGIFIITVTSDGKKESEKIVIN